ncbi:MAG: WxcM-like domain-containing protein [Ruminococcus sp.]|jgi:dTDP-4-dehydrorhamnose 3,5-epimerase-like enzyme|nr:WxcM-like domain-containing protein [Ruminococcus sp.]
MNIGLIEFPQHTDEYGSLVPIEESDTVPFDIKRVYYIYGVENGMRRGFHSHVNLEQVLICVSGHVKILVKTPWEEKEILLNHPRSGLYIGPMVWREMFDFSEDAVLLVLASDHYRVEDYIRDYNKYEKMAQQYFAKP